MARKKLRNQEELLRHNLIIRVNDATYERLKKIQEESDCQSIAEVARKVLSNQRIKCFYRDISLNGPMEQLALVRKEIKAIGININQQTHKFHISETPTERAFHHIKTTSEYKRIEAKIDRLLAITSKLAEKWLQKS